MFWLNLSVAVLLGLAVGSFLNVVADRIPKGLSLLAPPSHCPVCGTRIRNLDLVPVVSYLWLRGRCRNCSSKIPARTLLIELATGVMFGLVWVQFGWSFEGIALAAYASLFLAVAIVDLEHKVIPNKIVLAGLIGAIGIASFVPEIGLVKALIGAGAGFGIMLVLYLIPGFVIGEGDVKLASVVGAATGFPIVIVGIGLSFVIGGMAAICLILFGRTRRKSQIPFGPFIATAALFAIVWGEPIMNWYLNTFMFRN